MFSAEKMEGRDWDLPLIRHLILNTLRSYNSKFRNEFGQMVVAVDSDSWRKGVFPNYKAKRKKNRDNSDIDWPKMFEMFSLVENEISENFAFPVVKADGAEADDVIATLTIRNPDEKVLIISSDKDFLQLQKFKGVSQFSPMKNSFYDVDDPMEYWFEHVCKGDSSDGVPNILSPDDIFMTEGSRQKPVTKKRIEAWKMHQDYEGNMTEEEYTNFKRNMKLISLIHPNLIPENVTEGILSSFESQGGKNNSKVLSYLIKNRCKMLVECVEEFFCK
jgi:hypothetical protein